MDSQEIKELMRQFDESSLTEFSFQQGDTSFKMSKNDHPFPEMPMVLPASVPEENQIIDVQTNSEEKISENASDSLEGHLVTSPIVGTVYLSSAPDQPTYKQVGDEVQVGETLCIVEAMKLMNEIPSDVAGKVAEILVENEQLVEYGQPLFRIV